MDPLRPVKTTLLLQSIVSNVLSRFLSQYQQKRTWRYVQYSYLPATVFRQQGSEGFMFCCRSYAHHIRGDQTPVVDSASLSYIGLPMYSFCMTSSAQLVKPLPKRCLYSSIYLLEWLVLMLVCTNLIVWLKVFMFVIW